MPRHKSFSDPDIILGVFADTTALKNFDTSDTSGCPQYTRAFVEGIGEYYYHRDSIKIEDLPLVVAPTNNIGRWLFSGGLTDNNIIKKLDVAIGITGATNGLTLNGNTVKLGGNLIQNTNIDGSFDLTIGGSTKLNYYELNSGNVTDWSRFNMDQYESELTYAATGGIFTFLNLNTNEFAMEWQETGMTSPSRLILNTDGIGIDTQNNSAAHAFLKTTNITTNRTFEFPDNSGTLALLSDISGGNSYGSNGITKVGDTFELGGTLYQNTAINGAYNFELGTTTKLSYFETNAGITTDWSRLNMDQYEAEMVHSESASGVYSFINLNSGDAAFEWFETGMTSPSRISLANGGVGIDTQNNSAAHAYLKTTNITTDKTFEFPNQSGTLALTSDISAFVSNGTYGTAWSSDISITASRDALYNKFETLLSRVTDQVQFQFYNSTSLGITTDNDSYTESWIFLDNIQGQLGYGSNTYYDVQSNKIELIKGSTRMGIDSTGPYIDDNGFKAYLKNTGSGDRTVTFQSSSGTVAYLSDINVGYGSNGITKVGDTFKFGGTLIENTSINTVPSTYTLSIGDTSSLTNSYFSLGNNNIKLGISPFFGSKNSIEFISNIVYKMTYSNANSGGEVEFDLTGSGSKFKLKAGLAGGTNWAILNTVPLTNDRTFSFPDASGTFALTTDVQTYTEGNGIDITSNVVSLDITNYSVPTAISLASSTSDITLNAVDGFVNIYGSNGQSINIANNGIGLTSVGYDISFASNRVYVDTPTFEFDGGGGETLIKQDAMWVQLNDNYIQMSTDAGTFGQSWFVLSATEADLGFASNSVIVDNTQVKVQATSSAFVVNSNSVSMTITNDIVIQSDDLSMTCNGSNGEIYHESFDFSVYANNTVSINSTDLSEIVAGGKIQFTGTNGIECLNTNYFKVPVGTTAQRGTAVAGNLRFNTDTSKFEGYDGTTWVDLH
jgi:hypothetical protein